MGTNHTAVGKAANVILPMSDMQQLAEMPIGDLYAPA